MRVLPFLVGLTADDTAELNCQQAGLKLKQVAGQLALFLPRTSLVLVSLLNKRV